MVPAMMIMMMIQLKSEDIHIMNPGSATGAFSPLVRFVQTDCTCSFYFTASGP